ncbi:MAG TPA: hypothetical protein PLU79_20085 [Burkholderiaceae bacterium]|nr:hypothetical protein [Burkholderiaceae bacterium]
MCKTDKDCANGETCVRGVCTKTARRPSRSWLWTLFGLLFGACMPNADTVPDPAPAPSKPPVAVYSSRIGSAEGSSDDDYAADPPKLPQHEGPASFASTTERVLEAGAQGQGGYYGKTRPIKEAAECQALLQEALATVPGCATEMLPGKCSRGATFQAIECPRCAEMIAADDALAAAGCGARPEYPTLRAK